jgi:hypothetical protein
MTIRHFDRRTAIAGLVANEPEVEVAIPAFGEETRVRYVLEVYREDGSYDTVYFDDLSRARQIFDRPADYEDEVAYMLYEHVYDPNIPVMDRSDWDDVVQWTHLDDRAVGDKEREIAGAWYERKRDLPRPAWLRAPTVWDWMSGYLPAPEPAWTGVRV